MMNDRASDQLWKEEHEKGVAQQILFGGLTPIDIHDICETPQQIVDAYAGGKESEGVDVRVEEHQDSAGSRDRALNIGMLVEPAEG